MLSINTNLSSLIAQGSMKQSTNKLNQAIERMTTGFKINHAKDNAANYSIATNMTTKIGAYNVAEDNAAMGLDLISTAEGTLSQIEDKLQRLRALAEQASNGTYGEQSLNAINAEANALVDEINRLYSTAEYNGIKIFESQVVTEEPVNRPKAGTDGFINAVTKRDTSTMTSLASVSSNAALADGTYSISSVEELQKLAEMTNNGFISSGDEFVLACDIDLSGIENWTQIGTGHYDENGAWTGRSFTGKFDGNGYSISNMRLTSDGEDYEGFFGYISGGGQVKNLAIINASVKTNGSSMGIIAGQVGGGSSKVINCYTSGTITNDDFLAGGIAGGEHYTAIIDSCYSTAIVQAGDCAGGVVGDARNTITNCFFEGEVYSLATNCTGGIAGKTHGQDVIFENCYVNVKNDFSGGVFVGYVNPTTNSITINNSSYNTRYTNPLIGTNKKANAPVTLNNVQNFSSELQKTNLQIGIYSNSSSEISVSTAFDISGVDLLACLDSRFFDTYYLKTVDALLARCSEKQTHFGATSNRLESVLEEITIQRDNLISSRSTIRDADIAEVSSHYIQQQILQQASATLLATANQSPSIALQLI